MPVVCHGGPADRNFDFPRVYQHTHRRPFLEAGSQMEACRSATCTWIDVEYASTPQLVRIVPMPIRVGMIRSSPGTGQCRCRSAPGARPGPVNRSSCPCRRRASSRTKLSTSGGPLAGARLPQAAVLEDLFDHVRLGRFDERHYLHLAAALRTDHRVNFGRAA